MNYTQSQKAHGQTRRAPFSVCELAPNMFAQTWNRRPEQPVRVGLRLLSATDEKNARAEAEQYVQEFKHEDRLNFEDCFNSTFIGCLVSRALCDPDDADRPCGVFPVQDHQILESALGSRTLAYLFAELEKETVALGLGHAEATDDDIARLREYLEDGSLGELPQVRQRTVRRFCRFVLEELSELEI
jgi:hypothetical protein